MSTSGDDVVFVQQPPLGLDQGRCDDLTVNRPERSAFAGFSRRLAAGLVDWLIVFVALWLTAVIRATIGEDGGGWSAALTVASVVALPLLYFSLLWTRSGQTYGMRAAEIRMISTDTWEPPNPSRAVLRALVAVVTFAACWVPLMLAFSDESGSAASAVIAVGVAFAALALIGHLLALRDASGQSLQDRLFGLAVVDAELSEQRSEPGEPALSGRSE
jgi:uncharacterized RDD family membrane protein YckC